VSLGMPLASSGFQGQGRCSPGTSNAALSVAHLSRRSFFQVQLRIPVALREPRVKPTATLGIVDIVSVAIPWLV
jgi:hypothetical protein